MSDADTVIAVLRKGHDELAGFVGALTDDDLLRPSAASEWDVSQVLSHLGSGAEIGLAGLEAAITEVPRPGQEFNVGVWDRWNAMSPRERADGFLRANETLVERYESLDAKTRDSMHIDLGFLPAPVDVATAARMRLSEFALHAWDIRAGFDETATLPADAAAALLHGQPDLTAWIAKPEPLNGQESVLRVTTTAPDSVFALHLETPVKIDFDVPPAPDGALDLPAESWLRLASGRLAPHHTPSAVTTTGKADLGLLRQVFPGY